MSPRAGAAGEALLLHPEAPSPADLLITPDAGQHAAIPADTAPCPSCLAELFDPSNRRFRYPFIDCATCGPRLSVVESLPFERRRTTMRDFPMCDSCRAEYGDAHGRRFDDETISCPNCGPALRLADSRWRRVSGDALRQAADALRESGIVALKGAAGYQLVCDATDDQALARLRRRTHRPHEPFVIMAPDLETARHSFVLNAQEEAELSSAEAPVLLAAMRTAAVTSDAAPGFVRAGVCLPSTPLLHLLARDAGRPLVLIPAGSPGEPIRWDDTDARSHVRGHDLVLFHDRRIAEPGADTVLAVRREAPVVLRRGRTRATVPLEIPVQAEPMLATGAGSRPAFCLADGTDAFLAERDGTLASADALQMYTRSVERRARILGIEPALVAHDASDDGPAVRFASSLGVPLVPVEHVHGHIAAVMAEHGLDGSTLGIVFDAGSVATDGAVWGGEFLVSDWTSSKRIGNLLTVRVPGGESAVNDPLRLALAHADDAGCLERAMKLLHIRPSSASLPFRTGADASTPPTVTATSSAEHLFAAVAALTGICREADPGGRAATLLEQAADGSATHEYPFDIGAEDGRLTIDTRPIVTAIVRDLVQGRSPGQVAGRFHRTMAAAVAAMGRLIAMQTGLRRVCLAGEVFADDLLASDVGARLASFGFEVFVPRAVPIGDDGIALGQVLTAAARRNANTHPGGLIAPDRA